MRSTILPREFRPGLRVRKLEPGLHLPCWFIDGIKGIDENLHFVWHPYKVLYDDIINADVGSLEDPRYYIGRYPGLGEQEIWGHPLKNRDGSPARDDAWHIWRLCRPYGWAHVMRIDETHDRWLKFCLSRLYLSDQISSKYGHRAWNLYQREEQLVARQNKIDDVNQLLMDTTKENKWLMKQAMENFERGIIAPTNPTRDVIRSYTGQTNHSRMERPLTDKEGGLILPHELSRED